MNFLDLRLMDIKNFVVSYEERSLSKAAALMFTTRQVVARSIDHIESVVGAQLFERSFKGLCPSKQGDEFYAFAKEMLTKTFEFQNEMENGGSGTDTIRLGIVGRYQSGRRVEELLLDFAGQHNGLRVEISECEWPNVITQISEHELDFAYLSLADKQIPENFARCELKKDDFYVIVRKDGPYGRKTEVPATILSGAKIALLSRYGMQIGMLEQFLSANNIVPESYIAVPDIFFLDDYVRNGEYTVLLLDYAAEHITKVYPEYTMHTLSPTLQRTGVLIYRREMKLKRIHAKMIAYLKKELEK